MRTNINVSTLFGSMKTSGSAMNFAEMNSIRKGGYRKLLKSYYTDQKKFASEKKELTDKIESEKNKFSPEYVVDKSLASVKKESDGLKKSAEALNNDDLWKQTNGQYDMDKIADSIKSFASDYNDVIDKSGKTSSKEVSQNTRYMTDLTNVMSKTLSKIGVSIGTDGKMSVNEDALKKADINDVKSLFSGKNTYGSQVAEKAASISKATVSNTSLYQGNGMFMDSSSSMFNKFI